MNEPKPYFLFTHTPLHVGAGQSVGYVDLPIQREPHTKIPIVPGSSLKGVLRDKFNGDGNREKRYWLFGHDTDEKEKFSAGALLIGEARVLCFPVRSAKGSFAWITCPLVLKRAERDIGLVNTSFGEIGEKEVVAGSKVTLDGKVVLEEYTFTAKTHAKLSELEKELAGLVNDPVWKELPGRLVIVADGVFTYFAQSGCEIAQHVAIDDETGTAKDKALFNEETVPSETLFYGVMAEQTINGMNGALKELATLNGKPIQVGGGETTGLGWCTFVLKA
jgi:CRISPR-associated protein Cmr4